MMRFVDVTNDVAFRKIFGNEKKAIILISLLNAILKLEGNHAITHIYFLDPYQLPRVPGEKASIIDVKAQDAKGRRFLIEMQLANVRGFDKRVQYYASKEYAAQIDEGRKYEQLKPTYFIGILDFNFFKGRDYLSHHLILDKKTHEHKLKDISFTFIELKKFTLRADELGTLTEKWIYFIKHSRTLRMIPDNTDDAGLMAAYQDAERYAWTKRELNYYEDAALAIRDAVNRIAFAKSEGQEEGIEKGRREGRQEGRAEEKYEMAKKCLAKNMTAEVVSELTDLPIEEIEKIKNSSPGDRE